MQHKENSLLCNISQERNIDLTD